MILKVLAAETDLTSATNVSNATVVRLYNGHSAALVITRADSGSSTIGSFTLKNGETVYVEKDPTDLLSAASNGGSVKAAKEAYNIS